MISLLPAAIIAIILLGAFIIIISNKPDFWFWIFLNLYFDPGGYVGGYRGGSLAGPLGVADVCIVFIIICLTASKINIQVIYKDKLFLNFLLALTVFSLYYFIVYGGIIPYLHNDFAYPNFIVKNRQFIYGFIILFAVYIYSLRDLRYFYSITLITGVICLSLFLITLITGIELIPVWHLIREGTEMTRVSMHSYGIFNLIFPVALIVFLLSKKISINVKYKTWLYYGGILMLFTLLITLTKRTQIDIIGTVILIILLISYIFRTGKVVKFIKLLIPAVVALMVLNFIMPKYGSYVIKTAEDTILIILTGKDARGASEERVTGTGDLDLAKEFISTNILFGTGWTYLQWYERGYASSPRGEVYSRAADAAGEVPIYYLLFGFGIFGALLIIPLYYMLGKLFFNLLKLLRLNLSVYLGNPLFIVFSIYVLSSISLKFTINLYQLSSDFMGPYLSGTAVLLGLGFALYNRLLTKTYPNNLNYII